MGATRPLNVVADTDSVPQAKGGCFGFEIRSQLSFEYLRTTGDEPLYISEGETPALDATERPLYEWAARPGERVRTSLYASGGSYVMEVDTAGWFRVGVSARSIVVPALRPNAQPAWREAIIWGTPIGLCFMAPRRLSLHAASVDVGGQGLLLAAPGTFGKTTLAGAFLREGLRLLSDDVSCCDLTGTPVVFPGPALLRLRPDVFEAVEFPKTRVAHRSASKIAVTFDGAQRGDGRPVPLRGIVLLHRSDTEPRLERIAPHEAIRDLVVLTSNVLLDEARAFQDVTDLVNETPVWRLDRRLAFGDLSRTVDLIATRCLTE